MNHAKSEIPAVRDRKRIVQLRLNGEANRIAAEVEARRKAAYAQSAKLGSTVY